MTKTPSRQRDGVAPVERATRVAMVVGIVALVALTFGPALFGFGVFLDVDLLQAYWPWTATGAVPAGAMWCRGDTFDALYPAIVNTVESARAGVWPTWTPYEVGGAPMASLPNHTVLSPVTWPFWVLPSHLAPAWVKLTELLIVVVGMVALLGRWGVRRSAALLAAFVFFTSGFMLMWTNWPHTRVAVFIPLLFWALDRVVVERRARDVAWVGLVVASMLLGGFPAVTLFALTTGAVYVLVLGWRQEGTRATVVAWAGAAGGVLLGVALSAVQILPFVMSLGNVLAGREARDATPTELLVTSVAPGAWGTCVENERWGSVNPIEGIAYVGAGAVLLLLVVLVMGRSARIRPGVVGLMSVLLVTWVWLTWFGGAPLELLQTLPGFDTNKIGRAASIVGFLVALVAAFGLDRLVAAADEGPTAPVGRRLPLAARIALGAFLALGAVYVAWRVVAVSLDAGTASEVAAELVLPAIWVIAGIVVLSAGLMSAKVRRIVPVAVVIMVVVQATMFARHVWPLSDRSHLYPVSEAHEFLQANIGEERYASGAMWGYPATSDYYKLRTPVGHEFTAPAWKELLNTVAPDTEITRTYSRFSDLPTREIGDNPLLDQFSVKYWAVRPSQVVGELAYPSGRPSGAVTLDDGERATCRLPAGGLRGLSVEATRAIPLEETDRVQAHVRVTAGDQVIEGVRAFAGTIPKGPIRIGLAGEDLPSSGDAEVEVWFTGTKQPVELAATDDGLWCEAVRPRDDGLRLVHTDAGSVVYERLTSLPRIRWAGESRVVESAPERLDLLKKGIASDEVLLDEPGPFVADGSSARVDPVRDDAGSIEVEVDATGDGYLVVADSIAREGWVATVDGEQVDLLPANHAFAAVPVPEGRHTVELEYRAPGVSQGLVITGGAVAITAGLFVVPLLWRRKRSGGRAVDDQLDAREE
ncbi:YfhO family protein [Aeromicrobium duanguangcaii]|uniref:YfhO family protein n=1 Tax=Aeromicrobium duanguangcaii TaxID=2968086 RepID=A0ABY5KEK1_9ACTN|nr:YfhO family protein [Aeromicrobium duanguangcaii]MCD9154164.1 YfhO family protein [Aeromicrobium duanguangcaii]UUI68765.1 YfhO family protein [Aeromicrobium duanguangcaii]